MDLSTVLSRYTVVLANAEGKLQRLQIRVLAGEVLDGVEDLEQYGFSSVPLAGAGGVALFFGGDRSHGVALPPNDKRYRPTDLQPGDVAIYTDEAARITLRRGRIIDVDCDVYRIKAKHYEVQASETISLKTDAFKLDAATAESTAAIRAPDVVLGDGDGKSMVGHTHQEHDGPPTGGPQ
ncbi:phage baseplate assembly protein V subfamily protein [Pandoraea eparura]|uniref:Phage baseplate assembly protein V subfamily protein n=1 Tax=Pandoraea eparura TaxID=2508291 RepID=A0A5E4SKL7_9BURK|nr:phage baseplate assembly protein V [Pandoraea eparura]VVD76190.1 phage baseplate assembly protein V subfamily protein [Pandoraea eparura]